MTDFYAAGRIRDSATCGPAPKGTQVLPHEALATSRQREAESCLARPPIDDRAPAPRSPASPLGAPNLRLPVPALPRSTAAPPWADVAALSEKCHAGILRAAQLVPL